MTFSISEAIRFGWHQTKKHSSLLFKILLTLFALQVVGAIVSHSLEGTLIGALAMIALSIAQYVIGIGFALITLRIAQGKHTEFKEIIPPLEMLWRCFAASFLVGLMMIPSVILFFIAIFPEAAYGDFRYFFTDLRYPALAFIALVVMVYVGLRFGFYRFAVLDGAGIITSLKCSSEITKTHIWHLLGFMLVLGLLNIAGAIVFLVGLLITIPVSMIAFAHVYQKLHKGSHMH